MVSTIPAGPVVAVSGGLQGADRMGVGKFIPVVGLMLIALARPAGGCPAYEGVAPVGRRYISDAKWQSTQDKWQASLLSRASTRRGTGKFEFEPHRLSDFEFLRDKFGFEFDANHNIVKAPTRAEFIAHYRALMDEYVKQGIIRPEDVILPGNAFLIPMADGLGKLSIVPAEHRPLEGWIALSPAPSPRLYSRFLKEGYHPMDDGSYHDSVGHLMGYARYPKYMAALRKAAADPPVGPGKLTRAQWTLRYIHLLEGFALMPESSRPELKASLAPLFGQRNAPGITVKEVEAHYATATAPELLAQSRRLMQLYMARAEKYGGSAMEIGALGAYSGHPEIEQTLFNLVSRLQDHMWLLSEPNAEARKDAVQKDIANLEVAMWESSFIPVEDFIAQFTQPTVPKESPVHRFFVESGLGEDILPSRLHAKQKLVSRMLEGTVTEGELLEQSSFKDFDTLGRTEGGQWLYLQGDRAKDDRDTSGRAVEIGPRKPVN
jgi:hypothetical protein